MAHDSFMSARSVIGSFEIPRTKNALAVNCY